MRNLRETLKWAERKKIALGHFNVSNFEQFKAVAETALKFNVPILLGVSEGERNYWGEEEIKGLVDAFNKKYGEKNDDGAFWIFLNADHTKKMESAKKAAKVGFDEIIFDKSEEPLKENIELTKKAVFEIKKINKGILVEGEIGYIGTSSEVWEKIPEGVSVNNLTTLKEAEIFVKETKVDMLAPAVGNIHGLSSSGKNPQLDIKRIKDIKRKVKIPLVLHGGSGISPQNFSLAIKSGINVIHISTELRVAWRKGMEKSFKLNKKEVAPYKLSEASIYNMKKVLEEKVRLFYDC